MNRETHELTTGPVRWGRATWWIGLSVVLVWSGMSANRSVLAVPARPAPIETSQPDGTPLVVFVRGDEFVHWYEDPAGYLVMRQAATNQWVYATLVEGQPQATALVVGRDNPAGTASTGAALAASRDKAARAKAAKMARNDRPDRAGPRGTVKNLVILAGFSDKGITISKSAFDSLFNQEGYGIGGAGGSVRDYYLEVSYSALTLNSTVADPVTLDNTLAYYGQNDAWGDDLRPAAMVRDALIKLEAAGFDFSTMDGDGDGYLDCLTVVHAGEGEENGNDPNQIWSHKWQLGNPVTYDGVVIEQYVTVPELKGEGMGIVMPGVICHELGHHFGLPDLYDRDNSSLGAGPYCVMAYGSWNGGDGEKPAHFSAWCKMKLDFVQPTVVSKAGTYAVGQAATNASVYKIQGAFSANEYFLLENRQGVKFDQALPGSNRGILIWHVDDSKTDNDDESHYMVGLEEADGDEALHTPTGVATDADYFRAGHVTTFDKDTTPGTLSHDGSTPLGLGVYSIGPTGSSMTFTVQMVDPLSISGFIGKADGAGVDGVLVSEDQDGGWDITDTNGMYRVPVRYGWSGTVTPSKPGYTFGPSSRSYTSVTASIPTQDFTAVDESGGGGGGTGTLTVTTVDEQGASLQGQIYVDSQVKGTGSWTGTLSAGAYQVSYGNLDGYTKPDAQTVTVVADQTTTVTGTYTTGESGSFTVTVTAEPNLVQPGGFSLVTAEASGGVSPYKYLWNTGNKMQTFLVEPEVSATYSVVVTDSTNATANGSVQIVVPAEDLVVDLVADPNQVEPGTSSTLTATITGGVEPYAVTWDMVDPNDANATDLVQVVTPTETTDYAITVTDFSGQEVGASVTVNYGVIQGVTEPNPCFAPMGPLAVVAVAAFGWSVAGYRRKASRDSA